MNGLDVPYFLCPAVTLNIFSSGGDGDSYGEFYSLALTVMKMYFFECDRKCWAKYYSTLVSLLNFSIPTATQRFRHNGDRNILQ